MEYINSKIINDINAELILNKLILSNGDKLVMKSGEKPSLSIKTLRDKEPILEKRNIGVELSYGDIENFISNVIVKSIKDKDTIALYLLNIKKAEYLSFNLKIKDKDLSIIISFNSYQEISVIIKVLKIKKKIKSISKVQSKLSFNDLILSFVITGGDRLILSPDTKINVINLFKKHKKYKIDKSMIYDNMFSKEDINDIVKENFKDLKLKLNSIVEFIHKDLFLVTATKTNQGIHIIIDLLNRETKYKNNKDITFNILNNLYEEISSLNSGNIIYSEDNCFINIYSNINGVTEFKAKLFKKTFNDFRKSLNKEHLEFFNKKEENIINIFSRDNILGTGEIIISTYENKNISQSNNDKETKKESVLSIISKIMDEASIRNTIAVRIEANKGVILELKPLKVKSKRKLPTEYTMPLILSKSTFNDIFNVFANYNKKGVDLNEDIIEFIKIINGKNVYFCLDRVNSKISINLDKKEDKGDNADFEPLTKEELTFLNNVKESLKKQRKTKKEKEMKNSNNIDTDILSKNIINLIKDNEDIKDIQFKVGRGLHIGFNIDIPKGSIERYHIEAHSILSKKIKGNITRVKNEDIYNLINSFIYELSSEEKELIIQKLHNDNKVSFYIDNFCISIDKGEYELNGMSFTIMSINEKAEDKDINTTEDFENEKPKDNKESIYKAIKEKNKIVNNLKKRLNSFAFSKSSGAVKNRIKIFNDKNPIELGLENRVSNFLNIFPETDKLKDCHLKINEKTQFISLTKKGFNILNKLNLEGEDFNLKMIALSKLYIEAFQRKLCLSHLEVVRDNKRSWNIKLASLEESYYNNFIVNDNSEDNIKNLKYKLKLIFKIEKERTKNEDQFKWIADITNKELVKLINGDSDSNLITYIYISKNKDIYIDFKSLNVILEDKKNDILYKRPLSLNSKTFI